MALGSVQGSFHLWFSPWTTKLVGLFTYLRVEKRDQIDTCLVGIFLSIKDGLTEQMDDWTKESKQPCITPLTYWGQKNMTTTVEYSVSVHQSLAWDLLRKSHTTGSFEHSNYLCDPPFGTRFWLKSVWILSGHTKHAHFLKLWLTAYHKLVSLPITHL